jgi:hypothetical protein
VKELSARHLVTFDHKPGTRIATDLTREVLCLSTAFVLRDTDPGLGGVIPARGSLPDAVQSVPMP